MRRSAPFAARFGMMAVLFAATGIMPVGAQDALRAPLSIVPPPMQAVLGTGQTGTAISGKLAPRVAARQMKRAVRAVAATPGRDGDIVQIGQLGALEDAPIGLEAGLGDTLWTGARLAFVTAQMARLPNQMALPALYQLERRLHRGSTAAPVGTADNTSWFAARMMRLLALGDTVSAIDLQAETGAAKGDGYAARALVLAHLGRGERAAACDVPRPKRGTMGRRDTLVFFMQMLVYCQLLNGEFEKAGLTLELNEKTFGKDKLYRDIAYLMAAQAPLVFAAPEADKAAEAEANAAGEDDDGAIILPDELTPMQIALLQLAGQPLPAGLRNLPNYFMAAIAGDFAQDPALQLKAAHLAVRYGASPELFSQTAQLSDMVALRGALPPREKLSDGVFLGQALQVIDASPPQAQPRLVAHYLRQAAKRDLWHDMVRVLDDRLTDLAVPQAEMAPVVIDGIMTDARTTPDTGLDNPAPDALTPPAGLADIPPLDDTDRLVLLLAHWQAGHRMAAENLMRLAPLSDGLARLARWQGYGGEDAPVASVAAFDEGGAESADAIQMATLANDDLPAQSGDELAALAPADPLNVAFGGTETAPAFVLAEDLQPDWQLFAARLSSAGPAEAVYMRRQLALYHALGVALPETLLIDLVLPQENPVVARLTRLADNKWVGDLILAQVAELADKPAASYDATDTLLLVGSLRRAGLFDTAQDLAGDMLLAHTLALAVRAPHLLADGDALESELSEALTQTPFVDKPKPFRADLFEAGQNGR